VWVDMGKEIGPVDRRTGKGGRAYIWGPGRSCAVGCFMFVWVLCLSPVRGSLPL